MDKNVVNIGRSAVTWTNNDNRPGSITFIGAWPRSIPLMYGQSVTLRETKNGWEKVDA